MTVDDRHPDHAREHNRPAGDPRTGPAYWGWSAPKGELPCGGRIAALYVRVGAAARFVRVGSVCLRCAVTWLDNAARVAAGEAPATAWRKPAAWLPTDGHTIATPTSRRTVQGFTVDGLAIAAPSTVAGGRGEPSTGDAGADRIHSADPEPVDGPLETTVIGSGAPR